MPSVLGFTVVQYGDPVIGTYTVPGTTTRLNVRKEIAPILIGFAADFAALVEPLDPKTSGGHNPRYIEGTTQWSRHAPGIAIDLNWSKHPMGVPDTFKPAQVETIRRLISKKWIHNGVKLLRWGGEYVTRVDDMHFEINVQRDFALKAVAALQAPVHRPGSRTLKVQTPLLIGSDVAFVQRFIGPKYAGAADGKYGPNTADGVRWYQHMRGIAVDGVVGRDTWREMKVTPTY